VRYKSTGGVDEANSESGAWTSLADYVARMKPDQKGIYYVEGSSKEVLQSSPHLEQLKNRGFEVLLMTDGVDPFAVENLSDFEGHRLINAMHESLDLSDNEEKKEETDKADSSYTTKLKALLGDRVGDVRISSRLAESPACLVTPEGGLPPHMEAMFKAQNLTVPSTKRILELNPDHTIVKNLKKLVNDKPDAPQIKEWTELLYDQALIAEGSPVSDPTLLARRLTALLESASNQAVAD
jgi:molecular chaperone HtpG